MEWLEIFPTKYQDEILLSVVAIVLYVLPTAFIAWRQKRNPLHWGGLALLSAWLPAVKLIPIPMLYLYLSTKGGSSTSPEAKHFGQEAKHVFLNKGTGIAVDTVKQVVRLKKDKVTKEYPFTDVREWRANKVTGGEVIAAGGWAGVAAIGQNARVGRENREQTGLFVKVRDIDHPEWRIDMQDQDLQNRWMEILQQTLNENRH